MNWEKYLGDRIAEVESLRESSRNNREYDLYSRMLSILRAEVRGQCYIAPPLCVRSSAFDGYDYTVKWWAFLMMDSAQQDATLIEDLPLGRHAIRRLKEDGETLGDIMKISPDDFLDKFRRPTAVHKELVKLLEEAGRYQPARWV